MKLDMNQTIDDVALLSLTFAGRGEDDVWCAYQNRCKRLRILPLWGQLREALRRLHAAGKVGVKTVGGHKVCFKK